MKTGSYLMYKCRLCGETFNGGHAPDGMIALVVARGLAHKPPSWRGTVPTELTVHHDCEGGPGWVGLADLIGAMPHADVEEEEGEDGP